MAQYVEVRDSAKEIAQDEVMGPIAVNSIKSESDDSHDDDLIK
jgi:hypothetical protein